MKTVNYFFAEVTDTFGGEANYCWVRRYKIKANTERGAINKLAKHEGLSFRNYGCGRLARRCPACRDIQLQGRSA